jgi:hypothetical protein
MMRTTWLMMLGACALAACSRAEAPPAAQSADAAPDSAPAPAARDTATVRQSGAGTMIRIHPSLPPHAVTLHQAQPGVVDSIVVSVDGRAVQTLRPRENQVPPDAGVERLSTIDLDFDGYADLALLNMLAMANSTSEYWRFDPTARRFVPAGEFETLTPDSAARELTHHNRGGHGGRLWTAARWRWVDTALVPVAEEEQDALGDGDRYVHIRRQARNGKMVEVRRDTLEGEALRSTASWTEP